MGDGLKKDIDPSIVVGWGEENIVAGWGEENRGFQDEAHPPLPDLLIDLYGSGCSYNVGQDRVTLLQKSEVGEGGGDHLHLGQHKPQHLESQDQHSFLTSFDLLLFPKTDSIVDC